MTFRTILVGLGRIGMLYDLELDASTFVYTHARALTEHRAFVLAAAVEPDAGRRAIFEKTFGAPAYASVPEVGLDDAFDLAVVSTSTETHLPIVCEIVERLHPRAILCEKPLAWEVSEGREILRICEENGIALFVNYIRRADPAAIEVKRRIEAGEIAGQIKGVVWYSKGLLHNGSHFLDLVGHWLGHVSEMRVIDDGRPFGAFDREPDVRVEFRRGMVSFLAAREEAFSHYTIELVADNGRLRCERGGEHVIWQPAQPHPRMSGYRVLAEEGEVIPAAMDRYQWHVADQLAAAMAGSSHQLCVGREGLALLEHVRALFG